MTLDELKSTLWGAAVLLRGKINATGYKEYIFPLVFFKRISDVHEEEVEKLRVEGGEEYAEFGEYTFNIPKGCLWGDVREVTENVGQALVTAWTRIEQANPGKVVGDRVVEGLGGIFGKRDHWTNKNLLPDQTLSELIEHFSKIDLSLASCPADEMGNAYEYLVGKFADDAGNTAQEFYTNRTVVELMAEILEPRAGESIYDPTCGTGGMLISCIARCKKHEENWREIKAYGQEQNALTSSVARMNLFLHGVEEFRIVNDDTLLRPGFLDAGQLKTFDVVLANPPYSIKQWNREFFANDPYGRNFLGTPPQGRADYAFIQHIFKSMDPKTGRCAILLPHGVLFREEEKAIRKALVERDVLEAVIGLAPNLFYNSPMEACIMICRSRKTAATKGRVLFVNAVNEVTRKNAESKLEPAHIAKILKTYRERPSDGVFSYDATVEEIEKHGWSLAISLYAHAASVSRGAAETRSLGEVLSDFEKSDESAAEALVVLSGVVGADHREQPSEARQPKAAREIISHGERGEHGEENSRVEVERCRVGQNKTVRLGDVAEEVRGNWAGATEGVPVVGLEHLDPDDVWLRRWDIDPDENTFTKAFYKGQLLLGRRRVYQRKLSLAPCDGICSGDITVIAARSEKVLPELLPFYLRSDRFFDYAMQGSAGSLSPRVKWSHLADYEFSLPPLAEQKKLAELLWAANDLKEAYKKMIAATDEMLKAKFREMFGEKEKGKVKSEKVEGGEDFNTEAQRHREVAMVELSSVGKISTGSTPPMKTREYYEYKDIPFYKPSDFGPELSKLEDSEFWIDERARKVSRIFGKDAVLVTCIGTIGRVGLATREGACNQQINYIEPTDKVLPLYLATALQLIGSELSERAKVSVVPIVNKGEFSKLRIPLPPLALQQEFVEIARKAEEAKAALKKSIGDVEQVIKGLVNG